jgi:hypothetical protein
MLKFVSTLREMHFVTTAVTLTSKMETKSSQKKKEETHEPTMLLPPHKMLNGMTK